MVGHIAGKEHEEGRTPGRGKGIKGFQRINYFYRGGLIKWPSEVGCMTPITILPKARE